MRSTPQMPLSFSRNETRVLAAVSLLDTPTRRSISDFAGLGLASVSAAVASLSERRLLGRTSMPGEAGGRPQHVYHVRPGAAYTLGISFDPASSHAVLLDADGHIVSAHPIDLVLSGAPDRHAEDIVAHVAAEVRQAAGPGPFRGHPPLAVGVTLEGLTDSDRGVWVRGFDVTGISLVGIRRLLEDRLGLPVTIEDPARALAFAERRFGLAREADASLVVYLGSGVGSGILIGSRLYRGAGGLAGEIGHIVVNPRGYRCRCGDVGCLETVASTGGVRRLVRTRLEEGVVSSLRGTGTGPVAEPSLEELLQAAREGDRLARSLLHEVGELLGDACSTAIKLLNPDRLIIGGPLAMFAEFLQERVEAQIQRHVIPEMLSRFYVHFAPYEPHHEAWGGALLALERFWDGTLRELGASSNRTTELSWRVPPDHGDR